MNYIHTIRDTDDKSNKSRRETMFNEKYHHNCHDYLKRFYIEKYAYPRYKQLLYEIKEYIPVLNICNNTPTEQYPEIIVCDQHAVIFSHYLDRYPIMATYALNACIGLVIYIPEHKVGCLAHIDGLPGYSQKSSIEDGLKIKFNPVKENLNVILTFLKKLCMTCDKNDILIIDYYLIGGIFNLSEVMVNDIIECINEYQGTMYRFNFKGRNLLGPENQSRNICIDTRNGIISYFDYITNSEVYEKNVGKNKLPINIIKAPRKSEAFLDITYIPKLRFCTK